MKIFVKALIIFAVCMLLIAIIPITNAEESESEVIDLVPIPEPTPVPIPAPKVDICIKQYSWDQKTVDALASVFWAETGSGADNSTKEKLAITYLIFNRKEYGSPFANTIYGVCTQKNEFNRGRISDKNRKLAEQYLNFAKSRADGYETGFYIPRSAVYMSRSENKELVFYDIHWNEVWRSK